MTHSPTAIRALLAEQGLEPSRALGQNFVADPNTVRRIVRLAAVGPDDRVVEVGAGLGSLTLALREAGAAVTAVEVDRHLLPILRSVAEPAGATVVQGDAMHLDWDALLGPADPARPWVLVANLPYNIATPLVLDLLAGVPADRAHARDGAARGGGAAGRPPGQQGLRHPVGEGAVVGRRQGGAARCRPRCSSPRPGSTPPWWTSADDRRPVTTPSGPSSSGWWRPGSTSAARCCGARWPAAVAPEAFAAAGIRPEARAEELTLEDWLRLVPHVTG